MQQQLKKSAKASSVSRKILVVLIASASLLVVLHLVFQYVNMEVFYQQNGQFYELSNRFDLDDESSVATWYSQLLLLLIGSGAGLIAYMQRDRARRRLWTLLAAVGVLFSLDEIAGLHERLLQTVHVAFFKDNAPTGLANAWWILLPFILAAASYVGWKMLKLLPLATTRKFIISGIVFLVGAVAIDLITPSIYRETFLQQGLFVAAEESFELFGTVLALYAVIAHIELFHRQQISGAIKQLKKT